MTRTRLPQTPAFESVTVYLPVMNETASLEETVAVIERDCADDVLEYLMVVCDRTTTESRTVCERLASELGQRGRILEQQLPFLGGATREAFAAARGSHTALMASDLETPPDRLRPLIDQARANPHAIIAGSRWMEGGGFQGYSRLKFVLNYVFQRLFSVLYRTRLTDMTYGYRVFPTPLVQAIRWEELRHPFLFECLVKPLRLGVQVIELGTPWEARDGGGSQNTFMRNFEYFRIGLKTLLYSRSQILKGTE